MPHTESPAKTEKDAKALTDSIDAIADTVKQIVQLEINSLEMLTEDNSEQDLDLADTTTEGAFTTTAIEENETLVPTLLA